MRKINEMNTHRQCEPISIWLCECECEFHLSWLKLKLVDLPWK